MNRDYQFGIEKEISQKQFLQEHFDCILQKGPHYAWYDFTTEANDIYIELKNRRVSKETYPSTMVGYDKIEKMLKYGLEEKTWFVIGFKDGSLYKWKYDPDQFYVEQGGRCDRGRGEFKPYAYIRTKYLIPLQS